MTLPRTITEMQRRPTSYEIVAQHDNGPKLRLCFTQRTGRNHLLRLCVEHGETILNILPELWDGDAIWDGYWKGWQFGPILVYPSGKTERDIANEMGLL